MTNEEQKLREIVERWMGKKHPITMQSYVSDLTALISENYVEKAKYDELLQQRDELREALIEVMVILKDCYPLLFDNEKPAVRQAEAAIKNTETK